MRKHLFDSKEAKVLWKRSDDAIRRGALLSEIYWDTPKELRNVHVAVLELHVFNTTDRLKKKTLKWLNKPAI